MMLHNPRNILGLDGAGWLREINVNDATPGLTITQAGAAYGLTVNHAGGTGIKVQAVSYPAIDFFRGATRSWTLYDSVGVFIIHDQVNNKAVLTAPTGGPIQVNNTVDGAVQGFTRSAVVITNIKTAKVPKAHNSDLFDAAALTDSATIWTQPANTRLIAVMMKLTVRFVGAGIASVVVTMGDAGDPDGLLLTTGNLVSDAVATEYEQAGVYWADFAGGMAEGLASKRANASGTKAWIAYATAVGANLDQTSAGSIDFYFLYEEA